MLAFVNYHSQLLDWLVRSYWLHHYEIGPTVRGSAGTGAESFYVVIFLQRTDTSGTSVVCWYKRSIKAEEKSNHW